MKAMTEIKIATEDSDYVISKSTILNEVAHETNQDSLCLVVTVGYLNG